jgi:hypothetical protein
MSKIHSLHYGSRVTALLLLALVTTLLPSCKSKHDDVKLIPVSGKVTVDGKVLPMGTVQYYADESKGNTYGKITSGTIHADGTYKLTTGTDSGTKDGIPAGWYKVAVQPGTAVTEDQSKLKAESFNKDYYNPKKTKLLIEVKEGASADAYDIKLTK